MGRKSSSKSGALKASASAAPKKSNPLLMFVLAVAVVAVGALVWRSNSSSSSAESASAEATAAEKGAPKEVLPTPEVDAATRRLAAFGPHTQATLPPIPFQQYAPPRPPEVIAAAYKFAAEHPEVLAYVPCYCGCGKASGHRGNHDCFVKSRAENGDVTAYDEHGVECTVCIDVATRSRQMHASGASVAGIRAAIEKEYAPYATSMTTTPKPE